MTKKSLAFFTGDIPLLVNEPNYLSFVVEECSLDHLMVAIMDVTSKYLRNLLAMGNDPYITEVRVFLQNARIQATAAWGTKNLEALRKIFIEIQEAEINI